MIFTRMNVRKSTVYGNHVLAILQKYTIRSISSSNSNNTIIISSLHIFPFILLLLACLSLTDSFVYVVQRDTHVHVSLSIEHICTDTHTCTWALVNSAVCTHITIKLFTFRCIFFVFFLFTPMGSHFDKNFFVFQWCLQ